MSSPSPKNLAASIRQRLLNRAHQTHQDFNLVLTRYAAERFLYRLSRSRYAPQFVLKGALVFLTWMSEPHRPTRDVDLLGFGDLSDEALQAIIRDLASMQVEPDGLEFDGGSVAIADIREGQAYQGKRVAFNARLENARIRLQIDIGIGDVVTPKPEIVAYPTCLDNMPGPKIRTYPPVSVVAEKTHTLVALGLLNSRMKDFYDLWVMSRQMSFDGETLCQGLAATFERRQTPVPEGVPPGLSEEFTGLQDKLQQWQAFLKRTSLAESSLTLDRVIGDLRAFLVAPLLAAAHRTPFRQSWPPVGPWADTEGQKT